MDVMIFATLYMGFIWKSQNVLTAPAYPVNITNICDHYKLSMLMQISK